jgi:tRNA pseudouridine55 synthase
MGRGRKGRDISGWVIIDKPAGVSSNAVVNKLRWAMNAKKAGHAGTLDPEATGLLAVALGEATKTVPYITDALKSYEFTINLGAATNTDDMEGEVTETSDLRPTRQDIEAALAGFRGDIQQVPPQFSAVKIDGERAYKMARQGDVLELAARPLWVEELSLLDMPNADQCRLRMVCGKGGYVRAIARDLGQKLGCFGHINDLRRTWSGPFTLDGALTFNSLDDVKKDDALDAYLQPLELGLDELPELKTNEIGAAALQHGNPGQVLYSSLQFGDEAWASLDGKAIAVGSYRSGELHPSRVFNR